MILPIATTVFAIVLIIIGLGVRKEDDVGKRDTGLFLIVNGVLLFIIALFFFYIFSDLRHDTEIDQPLINENKGVHYETT